MEHLIIVHDYKYVKRHLQLHQRYMEMEREWEGRRIRLDMAWHAILAIAGGKPIQRHALILFKLAWALKLNHRSTLLSTLSSSQSTTLRCENISWWISFGTYIYLRLTNTDCMTHTHTHAHTHKKKMQQRRQQWQNCMWTTTRI